MTRSSVTNSLKALDSNSDDLLSTAIRQLSNNLLDQATKQTETPSQWLETNFYVPDPRDPVTGLELPNGPIRLADHQRRIIDEALSKNEDGRLKYSTVVYSAPKKSGKSALTSGVMLYFAHHNPNSYVACIANDGKQSTDRLYAPIYTNFRLHKQLGGIFSGVSPNRNEVILDNFTKIEPIPCDAAGEAGSQPILTCWSELWGFETETKRRVWTELTIPPTLYGRALRWVETYAGRRIQACAPQGALFRYYLSAKIVHKTIKQRNLHLQSGFKFCQLSCGWRSIAQTNQH